jgi:hypothetical protein
MAKWQNDEMLDAALDYLKNAADKLILCSAQPTTYAEATSTYALADVAIDSTDFTHANGDTSGRKTTIAAQNGVLIDTSGTSTHVAIVDDTSSKLLYVTTHTSQALVANGSNTVDIGSFKVEIADAS